MEGRYRFGTNYLNSTNLEQAHLLLKQFVAPGETKQFLVPIKGLLKEHKIPDGTELIGVQVIDDEPHAVTAESPLYHRTDFILQWYRLENLMYRITKILDASVVNDKQRTAIAELIVAEFYHMQNEYFSQAK